MSDLLTKAERDELLHVYIYNEARGLRAHADAMDAALSKAEAALSKAEAEIDALDEAIDRGGYDVAPCMVCGKAVVAVPDGLPCCMGCAKADLKRRLDREGSDE